MCSVVRNDYTPQGAVEISREMGKKRLISAGGLKTPLATEMRF
jgi:hypothetical protein